MLAPIKKSVQELISKPDFQIDSLDLDATTRTSGTSDVPEFLSLQPKNCCELG